MLTKRNKSVVAVATLCLLVGLILAYRFLADRGFEGRIVQIKYVVPLSIFPPEEAENSLEVAERLFEIPIDALKLMAGENGQRVRETTLTIRVKGDRYRIDTEQDGETTSAIYEVGSGAVTASDQSIKVADEIAVPQQHPSVDEDRFSMQATGEVALMTGFNCELYAGVNRSGDDIKLWLTADVKNLSDRFADGFAMLLSTAPVASATARERAFFTAIKGVPVLVLSITPSELEIQQTMEIVEQPVPDDVFTGTTAGNQPVGPESR